MKNNLIELIDRYTIKYDRFIKNICAPLTEHLEVPVFAYYTIEEDGKFCIISNFPKQLEFFYGERLYLTCPYLTHPRFFRSGCAMIPLTSDPEYLKLSRQLHGVNHLFLILNRIGNKIEGFFFTTKELDTKGYDTFLNQTDLLSKFGQYFKREAKWMIDLALADGYNVYAAKKEAFLSRDSSLPLANRDVRSSPFLKEISLLSSQEQICLDLFKQGKSAQATAALLGLSRRTVEHYFENIKNKLGCQSKWDLLQW